MSALTGIELAEDNTPGELRVVCQPDFAAGAGSKKQPLEYGTDVNVKEITRYYDHQVYLKDPRDPSLQA